jgi:hypothetical protein
MRRVISLVLALSLIVAGAIVYLIVHPHGARSWGYMAAGFLLAVGATWLFGFHSFKSPLSGWGPESLPIGLRVRHGRAVSHPRNVRFWGQSGYGNCGAKRLLLDQSGQSWILARDGLSAFDPKRTLPGNHRGLSTWPLVSALARGSVQACCFGSLVSDCFKFRSGPSP